MVEILLSAIESGLAVLPTETHAQWLLETFPLSKAVEA
jgi:hypothetical protein